jgi:death-on-curing protein
MQQIIYITLEQAKIIHQKTIKYSGGGTTQELDTGKLESVLQNIQNDDYYPTFVDKITHLFFCTCQFHCFADGNKRLAITLSAQFLLFNGYMATAKNFFTVMENISYQVAAGKIDKDLLHEIMSAVMNGTYDDDEELKLKIFNAIC